MEQISHIIAGQRLDSADRRTFTSIDPYRREGWAEVALGGAAEADLALRAARAAFDSGPWPRLPQAERSALLHRFADLVESHATALARLDTCDAGKLSAAVERYEVPAGVEDLRNHADLARLSTSVSYPRDDGLHVYDMFPPAGVVVAITPWNFPVPMAMSKIAPALARGNTVVLKPAEQTPASAALLAELAVDAGIAPGVFNVVQGYGPGGAGEHLIASPLADRVTFTGSTAAGAAIAATAARNLTPVLLECGGKSANLIFADADLDTAVGLSAASAFANSGQMCVAATRWYVQRAVYGEVVDRLTGIARSLKHGDPRETDTDLGPLVSGEQYERVRGYLAGVPGDGGRIVTGGDAGEGWFVRPAVVTGLPQQARAAREEIFGPVVVVIPFDDEPEAVSLANDSRYGLSASVFTSDLGRGHRVGQRLRAGIVWVNTIGERDWRAPFGGYRQSGLGREGGRFSAEFFTEPTAVVISHRHARE